MIYTTNATANISAKAPAASPTLIARRRVDFDFFDLDFNPITIGSVLLSSVLVGILQQQREAALL